MWDSITGSMDMGLGGVWSGSWCWTGRPGVLSAVHGVTGSDMIERLN